MEQPTNDNHDYGHLDEIAEGESWETLAIEAAGNVIEFWGFKRNQGRVWALLFLRDRSLSAPELQDELELSKGAVSMLLRDLESWGVVKRTRRTDRSGWAYEANSNLMDMIARVLTRREIEFLQNVVGDLKRAETLAGEDPEAPSKAVRRVRNMRRLGQMVLDSVVMFTKTAQFDARGIAKALAGRTTRALRKRT